MNLISCNFNCKYQCEGYCHLSDTENAEHTGNERCIYFQPQEEKLQFPFNSSSDSEPL